MDREYTPLSQTLRLNGTEMGRATPDLLVTVLSPLITLLIIHSFERSLNKAAGIPAGEPINELGKVEGVGEVRFAELEETVIQLKKELDRVNQVVLDQSIRINDLERPAHNRRANIANARAVGATFRQQMG